MKRIYQSITVLFIFFIISSCSKQIQVTHVVSNTTATQEKGIYYSLPKTVLTIEVNYNKVYKIKGPYADLANKYLGITNVINENSNYFELADIQINSYSIPDTDQYYFVEIPKSCGKKNAIRLNLTELGVLTGINEITKNIKPVNLDMQIQEDDKEPFEMPEQRYVNLNLTTSFDTIIEKVITDSVVLQKKSLKKVYVEKTAEQKAKEAADYIMKIREDRYNLLIGYSEVNYSKESFEFMNDELNKMEKEYLNLFTGITVTKKYKKVFTYIPTNLENNVSIPLFSFSENEGVGDISNNNKINVFLNIEKTVNTQTLSDFNNIKLNSEKKEVGFVYRIPEYGKISILFKDKLKAEKSILISQFGIVSELPLVEKMKASFNPNTGSLKTISVNKKERNKNK